MPTRRVCAEWLGWVGLSCWLVDFFSSSPRLVFLQYLIFIYLGLSDGWMDGWMDGWKDGLHHWRRGTTPIGGMDGGWASFPLALLFTLLSTYLLLHYYSYTF
ncbi:hypothetical protein VTJ04DRAFT_8537 [Mycothermus thermophilus]|uniref:uncharacterized protein n=1 Tax=Humicola insolens TaxID=85995 RepID=UPI00374452EE